MLKCENLHKKIGKKEILKGVNVAIYESDILGLIGPNGAGKTTTIKLILGLQNITSGSVTINGHDIQKDFTKAISKVGAIIENPDLYLYLTGFENLKLAANLYPGIDKKRIDEVVKLVGLENRIHDKISKYSLGMRQRLGIAQAILHKPNLLILDEPTNGLDPEGIKQMRDLLKMLAQKEKMSILISSHNLAEIETLCNKVCIIQNGQVIETSDLETVKKEEHGLYIFEVDSTKQLNTFVSQENHILNDNEFTVKVEKEEVPNIVQTLVENHVKVYRVEEEKMSLEDAFLKKTGGNIID
ncbi:MAG: ABC transporter ATP-binding protein [Clostridia bacterium]|nr:ABC transporter ATP-binding protein [Clostridia bacterium]